jgi:hypothetical protein
MDVRTHSTHFVPFKNNSQLLLVQRADFKVALKFAAISSNGISD